MDVVDSAPTPLRIWVFRADADKIKAICRTDGDLQADMSSVSVAFVTGCIDADRSAVVFACDFVAASCEALLSGVDRDLLRRRAGEGADKSVDAAGAIDGAALHALGLAAFVIEGDETAAWTFFEQRFETLLALKRARKLSFPDWDQALSR